MTRYATPDIIGIFMLAGRIGVSVKRRPLATLRVSML